MRKLTSGRGTNERHRHEKDNHMVGRRWRHGLLAVITSVWTVQFVAVLVAGFKPDQTVNAAFLLVAGAVFGVEAIRGNRRDDESGDQ